MDKTRGIVLVGRRNGAVRAAKALGLRYRVVESNCDDADVDEIPFAPRAAIALTEAAVLPAARLRARLGVEGLSVEAATRCTDKLVMKMAVRAAGLPCARCLPLDGVLDRQNIVDQLGLPLVLKTQVGSGGRGARVIRRVDELPARVSGAHLAESFVDGVEMSVESFVLDGEPVFTSLTRYLEPRWANIVPADLDDAIQAQVHSVNREAIAALGVSRGVTHLEVFLTADGVVFGELAARPPGGHLMRLIELAYGFDPWRALLEIECGSLPSFPGSAVRSAGVRFIYPDAGVVRAVHGLDAVRELATVEELVCKLQPGERIAARESTGQHRGYAIFAGSADQVERDLVRASRLLQVAVD